MWKLTKCRGTVYHYFNRQVQVIFYNRMIWVPVIIVWRSRRETDCQWLSPKPRSSVVRRRCARTPRHAPRTWNAQALLLQYNHPIKWPWQGRRGTHQRSTVPGCSPNSWHVLVRRLLRLVPCETLNVAVVLHVISTRTFGRFVCNFITQLFSTLQ